eukprot:Hpha_TRINITY_DN16105_c0_g1::TRINITY_DN16105_c0_g1_i2::g.7505::m.7505/K03514/PAPD5_7, TRF4; non-canonical poly(A) RNA polymerase PAPD5/7
MSAAAPAAAAHVHADPCANSGKVPFSDRSMSGATDRDHSNLSARSGSELWSAYSVDSSPDKSGKGKKPGSSTIVTPWFVQGVPKDQIRLSDEVKRLHNLLRLSSQERDKRKYIRSAVQDIVQRQWRDATVKVYGSFAYDCSLPDSAIDLVVECCGEREGFDAVVAEFAEARMTVECHYNGTDADSQAFVKLRGENGVVANISFVSGKSPVRQGVSLLRKLVSEYTAVPAVFATARLVLQQVRCMDVVTGGLSSYAVLLMILHAARRSANPSDPGQLLVDFFSLFGSNGGAWKISAMSRDAEPLEDASRQEHVVEDPTTGTDTAADCRRWPQIRSVLSHCGQVLARWQEPRTGGYRGRTPLSSILAYDSLWERAHAMNGTGAQW